MILAIQNAQVRIPASEDYENKMAAAGNVIMPMPAAAGVVGGENLWPFATYSGIRISGQIVTTKCDEAPDFHAKRFQLCRQNCTCQTVWLSLCDLRGTDHRSKREIPDVVHKHRRRGPHYRSLFERPKIRSFVNFRCACQHHKWNLALPESCQVDR